MGADQNFFPNRSVGLYPKITTSPQEFYVKFGKAMEELNQHKQALERASENSEANEKISSPICLDRSDRCNGPV